MDNLKTIDIQAYEWFDKVNGNCYFAAIVTLNFGMSDQTEFRLPYQYGYWDHYIDMATQELIKRDFIKLDHPHDALWIYCKDHNIILRTSKQKNCKKRDLKAII